MALYGIDALMEEKRRDKRQLSLEVMDTDTIRLSEELIPTDQLLGQAQRDGRTLRL